MTPGHPDEPGQTWDRLASTTYFLTAKGTKNTIFFG